MSNLSTLPKGDSAWLLRKAIERIMEQVSVLETNIGSSTTGNSANTQIIFNDNGTLRGDAGLVYNKTTDALTVAGLVTAGSATITGDLTVDTSTLKVDSTNHRVGIGTASPSNPLEVQSATAIFKLTSTTGTNPAYLYATSTGGDFYFGRDNSTGTTFGTGTGYSAIVYSANAYPMVFFTNAVERARITSSGDVNISTGNVVMGTSGKGIDFAATASGSGTMTSELLNDYEEGTFTPTVTSGMTAITYSDQTGSYVKIGRLVSFYIRLLTTAGTRDGGQVIFGGLPFNVGTGNGVAMIEYNNSGFQSGSSDPTPRFYLPGGYGVIELYNSNGSAFVGNQLGSGGFDLRIFGHYFVA